MEINGINPTSNRINHRMIHYLKVRVLKDKGKSTGP